MTTGPDPLLKNLNGIGPKVMRILADILAERDLSFQVNRWEG